MESIRDFISSISERFSNPLISAFCVSWIFINWQITVSLIWFDSHQIFYEGYDSIFELIRAKLNIRYYFYYPLSSALVYTFLMPIIRTYIGAFNSKISKWSENWNLVITGSGKIGVDKYIKLRKRLEMQSKTLEEIIEDEGMYSQKVIDLKSQNSELKNEKRKLQNQYQTLIETSIEQTDLSFLGGQWIATIKQGPVVIEVEKILIEEDLFFVLDEQNVRSIQYTIRDFKFNPKTKEIFFIKEGSASNQKYIYVNHLKKEDKDLLVGTENYSIVIEYKRQFLGYIPSDLGMWS